MFRIFFLVTLWAVASCSLIELSQYQEFIAHNGLDHTKNFLNEWTVQVDGGEEVAELVALELGYEYGGQVLGFPGTYIFYKYGHSMQRRTPSRVHTDGLNKDRRVRWADQLFSKTRVKRHIPSDSMVPVSENPEKILHRVKRVENMTTNPSNILDQGEATNRSIPKVEKRAKRAIFYNSESLFNDELWSDEWYLQDTRTGPDLPRLDLNVLPVYAMGVNGSGVRVTVLDDGVEHNHTDLKANYDPEISWDCNDGDSDPMPRNDERKLNAHGTRCAGEIAMTANNKKCGVGVAWGAKVGGVRLLDGQITDRIEGEAIGFAWDKVDIYSASWGPDDNGRTVEGPGRLASEAFQRGILKGRGGKGVIYVWANGNGGSNHDNCNCDGYASSIYTVSIASTSQHGLFPWYGEVCASTLATAYSSGAYKEQKIATTDVGDSCTLRHTGTSAAAPLAAGIIALALSANPNLTWRDVQHLIVWTSEYAPLLHNAGWKSNAVGLLYDIRFGFGLLNAQALVEAALNWTNVPEKHICRINSKSLDDDLVSPGKSMKIPFEVQDCVIKYIEHIELVVNLKYSCRGALEIGLDSPQGTRVPLLSARPKDKSNAGFVNWSLTSVATWGETPEGLWLATVIDQTNQKNAGEVGTMTLVIHGTNAMPAHMRNGPRNYNHGYNEYEENRNYSDKHKIKLNHNSVETPLEEESQDATDLNNAYPGLFDEVQNQLLRIHHRNPFLSDV